MLAMCGAVPAPGCPDDALLELAFSHAINSAKFVAGKSFLETIKSGSALMSATGSRSLSTSYCTG